MAGALQGKKIAFVTANEGVEEIELTKPMQAMRAEGATCELVATRAGMVQCMNHMDRSASYPVDRTTSEVSADDYDAIVLPGGVANPDQLRMDADAVQMVQKAMGSDKPVAAICHGPWTLVEADAVRGRTLTSWPSLQTDIRNAGGRWVDQEVCVDGSMVTSRKPDDLDAFCRALTEAVAAR